MKPPELLHRNLGPAGPAVPTIVVAVVALIALSSASARALAANPPPLALVLAGGLGALALLALAITRYDGTAVLGFALLVVVQVEPAPTDLVFATLIAVAAVTGRFRLDQLPFAVAAVLGLFLASNLASFIDAVALSRGVRFFAITAYLIVFAVWLTGYVRSLRRMRAVVVAYLLGAIAMSAAASLALFVSFPGSDLLIFQGGGRAQGLFKDPNVFGPFLIPALLILIEDVLKPRLLTRVRVVPKVLGIAVLALGLILCFSRAAWLNAGVALVLMLIVHALRRGGSRRAIALLSLLAVVGTVAVAVVALTGSASFLEQRARFQTYDVDRFGAQRHGIALVAQHPLGVGPGQFDAYVPVAAHSLYVRVLAEQGVVGVASMLLLLTITLFLALRGAFLGRHVYGVGSATLLGAWSGLIANSLVVDTLHWRHLWIVAAFIWIGAKRARPTA